MQMFSVVKSLSRPRVRADGQEAEKAKEKQGSRDHFDQADKLKTRETNFFRKMFSNGMLSQ